MLKSISTPSPYWFILSLFFTFFAQLSAAQPLSRILSRSEEVKSEYDYVIVGGGTAGLTLGDRLTEDGKHTVLVIEYGDYDNNSQIFTVAGAYSSFSNSSRVFSIPSLPNQELNGRITNVSLGKVLGGSSAVNGMAFHRGQAEDYDGWASFFPEKSDWHWKGILPYFKKASTFTPPPKSLAQEFDVKSDRSNWGNSDTKIFASFPPFLWPMQRNYFEAHHDISGVEFPPDSGAGKPGVFWFPSSADPVTVTRSFARTGHWDGLARSNYETITGSKVTKVTLQGRVAKAVEFVPSTAQSSTPDNTKIVRARKEIILSAGTIHSPQILQNSGIGPRSVLESASVSVKVELPGVGQNFQDHPWNQGQVFILENFDVHPSPLDLTNNASYAAWAQEAFDQNKTGPLTIGAGNLGAWLPFPVIAPDTFQKIVQTYESQDPSTYLPENTHPTIIAGYKAQQAVLAAKLKSKNTATYNMMFGGSNNGGTSVFLHPVSRGSININHTSPIFSEPLIDYRVFSNPIDLAILVEFVRYTRRYFAGPTMAKFKPIEIAPSLNVTTDEDITAWLRTVMRPSTAHPIGTCSMLPRELGGVVSSDLRVYGVERLRVVDASVMPLLPGAYTQQSTYAIAEKAADLIKASAQDY